METGTLVEISSSMVVATEGALSIEVYGERATAIYRDRPWPSTRFTGQRISRQKPPVGGVHALQRSLEGFRQWVMQDKPYLIPIEEALKPLAVVEAIYRSSVTGRRERVEISAEAGHRLHNGLEKD
jgi:predicted dehydrogenase